MVRRCCREHGFSADPWSGVNGGVRLAHPLYKKETGGGGHENNTTSEDREGSTVWKQATKCCHSTLACTPPSPGGVPSRRRHSGIPREQCPGPRWGEKTPRIAAGFRNPPRAQTVTCESTALPADILKYDETWRSQHAYQPKHSRHVERKVHYPGGGERVAIGRGPAVEQSLSAVRIDVSANNSRVANPLTHAD